MKEWNIIIPKFVNDIVQEIPELKKLESVLKAKIDPVATENALLSHLNSTLSVDVEKYILLTAAVKVLNDIKERGGYELGGQFVRLSDIDLNRINHAIMLLQRNLELYNIQIARSYALKRAIETYGQGMHYSGSRAGTLFALALLGLAAFLTFSR